MNNSSAAFFSKPQQTQPAAAPAPVQPQTQNTATPVEQKSETKHAPLVIPPDRFLAQLSETSDNKELWYLTYMMHSPEYFALRSKEEQNKPGKIRLRTNGICATNHALSRLEDVSRAVAYRISNETHYRSAWFISESSPPACTGCEGCEKNPFCISEMAAYIEYHCQNNSLSTETVYRSILKDAFQEKAPEPTAQHFDIPAEEYRFLNAASIYAAEQLIRMRWFQLKESGDSKVSYVYLPLCERTTDTFVPQALAFYRNQSGKHDFLRTDSIQEEVCINRGCTDCIFPQCPDKVAAYILTLSRKYGADPLNLARFIAQSNLINGVSSRGNFIYLDRICALNNIDFTPESRVEMDKIMRYILNHRGEEGSKAPLLPFHFVLYTKDDAVANEVAGIFRNTVFYYHYLKDCAPLQEYRFSNGGLDDLIKFIEELEGPAVLHIREMSLMGTTTSQIENPIMKMTRLNNLIKDKQDKLFIIVSGEKAKLDTALGAYSEFYHGTLHHKLTISDMPTGKVVNSILNLLEQNYELEEGFARQLENYVISQYAETPLKGKAFVEKIAHTIQFNHFNQDFDAGNILHIQDIPMASNRRSSEEIWRDLNHLTGLQTVKSEVRNIEQLITLQKKMASLTSRTMQKPNMHMVFAGNPGTGKTTVARLIAEILYNLGYIRQNKLVEVSPKDLVGQWVGHTAPKTAAVCESAYDGVLFIDEAYELASLKNSTVDQFRSECITELIKQMEDNRDRLVVIFAGYTDEMRKLLDSNAGFASRIGKIILFEDYSTDQLVDMFVKLVQKNGMTLQENAEEAVRNAIIRAQATDHFGNARYVRNLYEDTIREHAKNTVNSDDPNELLEISRWDIPEI